MKLSCFILSFYLLALACLPCEDKSPVFDETGIPEIVSVTSYSMGLQTHQETCSPLCCCSCCQITTTSPIAFISLPHPFFFSEIFMPDTLPAPRDIHLAIWQPPKIEC